MKTGVRDARTLAKAVYWGSFSEVVPLSEEDEAYRDYMRMRDDRKEALKKAKQHLLSFLLRRGRKYTGGKHWTQKHIAWLKKVEFDDPVDQMTFYEYSYEAARLMDASTLLDAKIEKFSKDGRYEEKVDKLRCFAGIDTHVAMVMLTGIGDFCRFRSAESFSSCLGLCPGEQSSGRSVRKTGITKAGNSHCRKLLCESADSIARTNPYRKSKRLLERLQRGQDSMCKGACLLHLGDDDRQYGYKKRKSSNSIGELRKEESGWGCPGRLTTVKILLSSTIL